MKRFLSMLMTLVLLCGCFAMAEVKTFDYKVLEGLDGYSYDKFEKMWSLAGEYRIKAADGYISVALIALGDKESVQGVMLTAGVYKSDGSIYGTIDKIEILADDTLISIKMMPLEGQQARLLTDTSAEALRLISEAKEISFKIALKNAGSEHLILRQMKLQILFRQQKQLLRIICSLYQLMLELIAKQ